MGIFDNLFGNRNKEQNFWQWFKSNSNRLAQVKTCREPVADELEKQINKVCKGLVFTFGPVVDGRREFIVSADGNRELFPSVTQLVQAAPNIPGWKIIAFRPPAKNLSSFKLMFGNAELGISDVWFSAHMPGHLFELNVFIKRIPELDQDSLAQVGFILLDHTIGEYAMETKIGRIAFDFLPDDPVAAGLRPLVELPQAIR